MVELKKMEERKRFFVDGKFVNESELRKKLFRVSIKFINEFKLKNIDLNEVKEMVEIGVKEYKEIYK